jgi:hypothetical protein
MKARCSAYPFTGHTSQHGQIHCLRAGPVHFYTAHAYLGNVLQQSQKASQFCAQNCIHVYNTSHLHIGSQQIICFQCFGKGKVVPVPSSLFVGLSPL